MNKNPFHSFWMAGYECADHVNAFGNRINLAELTGHVTEIKSDYRELPYLNIKTVREGIQWSRVETAPYVYDWSDVGLMIQAGREEGIQQVWDICHFGFPDDLTPLHPMFARRFAALCSAFVNFFRSIDSVSTLIITPINEVGFLSWLGGDVRGTSPFCTGQGWEVKYKLMQAYIEGVEAILSADPLARIMVTEPLVQISAQDDASLEEIADAVAANESQFQVTEILCGRLCPELRGKPEYLDIIGYNYYYNNQWILKTNEMIPWKTNDHRYVPLHELLLNAYQRYQRPIVLAETSHPKEDRPLWLAHICEEILLCIAAGCPLLGVCWYPILNRPDWDFPDVWHESGLWEDQYDKTEYYRIPHQPTMTALLSYQSIMEDIINDITCPAETTMHF